MLGLLAPTVAAACNGTVTVCHNNGTHRYRSGKIFHSDVEGSGFRLVCCLPYRGGGRRAKEVVYLNGPLYFGFFFKI